MDKRLKGSVGIFRNTYLRSELNNTFDPKIRRVFKLRNEPLRLSVWRAGGLCISHE